MIAVVTVSYRENILRGARSPQDIMDSIDLEYMISSVSSAEVEVWGAEIAERLKMWTWILPRGC